jgi:hypothetical protein
MSEVSVILTAIARGDLQAASELLPLVYEELRRQAYLRLVSADADASWDSRGEMFRVPSQPRK